MKRRMLASSARWNCEPICAPTSTCPAAESQGGIEDRFASNRPSRQPTAIGPSSQALRKRKAASSAEKPNEKASVASRPGAEAGSTPWTLVLLPPAPSSVSALGITMVTLTTRSSCVTAIGSGCPPKRSPIRLISATPPGTLQKKAVAWSMRAVRASRKEAAAPTTSVVALAAMITGRCDSTMPAASGVK